jgi:hypothetical protein
MIGGNKSEMFGTVGSALIRCPLHLHSGACRGCTCICWLRTKVLCLCLAQCDQGYPFGLQLHPPSVVCSTFLASLSGSDSSFQCRALILRMHGHRHCRTFFGHHAAVIASFLNLIYHALHGCQCRFSPSHQHRHSDLEFLVPWVFVVRSNSMSQERLKWQCCTERLK